MIPLAVFPATKVMQQKRYDEAVSLKPDYPPAHYNLSLALDRLGEPQKAKQERDNAFKLDSDLQS